MSGVLRPAAVQIIPPSRPTRLQGVPQDNFLTRLLAHVYRRAQEQRVVMLRIARCRAAPLPRVLLAPAEGPVLVTLESLEDVTEPRVTPGPELAVEQKAFDVSREHDQTESCEKDACDESHQHVHGGPNLSGRDHFTLIIEDVSHGRKEHRDAFTERLPERTSGRRRRVAPPRHALLHN